ncbi:MAG: hypothetical protein ABI239_13735 [Aquihabitans sp.]
MASAPDPAAAFTHRHGVVTAYDDHAGLGAITDASTGFVWPFHCTRIADGSRTIQVGGPVGFRVEPQPSGLEAVMITTDDEPG